MTDNSSLASGQERILLKLDNIDLRLGNVEASLERQDERSLNHHERIISLESQTRKASWAVMIASGSVILTLIPLLLGFL